MEGSAICQAEGNAHLKVSLHDDGGAERNGEENERSMACSLSSAVSELLDARKTG